MINPLTVLSFTGNVLNETYNEFGLVQPNKSLSDLERQYTVRNSRFIEVRDSRIHYAEEGAPENPTLLFIHGTYSSLHTWDGWVEELADRYHIVRLDMPGFGLTGPRQNGEQTFEYAIETIGDFADALGLSDVTAVGNSLGGGIAWRLSLDRPDLVDRLILIDAGGTTLLARLSANLTSLGSPLLPRFITPRLLIRLIIRDAYGDPSKVTTELVRRYHDLLLRPGNRQAVVDIARNYAADHSPDEITDPSGGRLPGLPSTYNPTPDILDGYEIEDVSVPTLYQWGGEDRWLTPTFGRRLASRTPNSRFVAYPGVGHVPMEESPEQTAADAAKFLA